MRPRCGSPPQLYGLPPPMKQPPDTLADIDWNPENPGPLGAGRQAPFDTPIYYLSRRPTQQVLMPSAMLSPYAYPIVLLIGSNVFMTTAWYWHLRYKEVPLWQVILISWGLAFVEYCLAVPANRYGSNVYSAAQLKTIQEVVTLTVFGVFSVVYLQQAITWNQVIGFALIAGGAFFVFRAPL
jgi:uncharacterized protein (DUF486 family)